MYRSRNDAKKCLRNFKRRTEGFKPGASSCRYEMLLVTDAQGVLRLWRHHFSTLLRGEGDINAATREDSEPAPIDDDGVEIPPPSHNEIRVAIQQLKNNKTAEPDGLPAALFKASGDELVRSKHELIYRIWLEESMPSDWNLSALCPALKKGDHTICASYRAIGLFPIA